jgi:cytochrome c5
MRKLLSATAALVLLTPASAALAEDGETAYREAQPGCGVCHDGGVAGAPKVGDADSWGDRLDASIDSLTKTVLEGKGAMPAYGGRMDEAKVRAAVEWMVEQSQE